MKFLKILICFLLTVIGLVSLFMTFSILFDLFGMRQKEGNYVPFIVYANLVCGLIYLYAVTQIWKLKKSGIYALGLACLILILAFIALRIYISHGGIYEEKTIHAMTFRTVFTIVMTGLSMIIIKKRKTTKVL